MKKLKLSITLAAAALAGVANAQSVSFYADAGQILDAAGNVELFGGDFVGFFAFAADVAAPAGGATAPDADFVTAVQGLSWAPLVDGSALQAGMFRTPGVAYSPEVAVPNLGDRLIVLFTDAGSVGAITGGSELIVAKSSAFNTTLDNRIEQLGIANTIVPVAGIAGSLQAVTVVPEPSTYALLGGIAALGIVMYRRRRA